MWHFIMLYSYCNYVGDILNPIKKGNLFVILLVALLAFGLSNIAASFTNGDLILDMLNISATNQSTEMIAIADGNFTPQTANQVIEVLNVTNETNVTNITNTTNITNITNITNDTGNIVDQNQLI
jgi:hypothetical protein